VSSSTAKIFKRPKSQAEISELAEWLLHEADAVNVLPTPLEDLIEFARVKEVPALPNPNQSFLQKLSLNSQKIFKTGYQKIRGMADLRERVNYVPINGRKPRNRFARGHELGHQVMKWHQIDGGYLDRDKELSPDIQDVFESEANFFSSEVIFQGKRFKTKARDFTSSFGAMFKLADEHEASYQATIWRFVEEQDETIAVAYYYPISFYDNFGQKTLKFWKLIPSPKFRKRYGDLVIPDKITSNHPWVAARTVGFGKIVDGVENLTCGNKPVSFAWEAWWNSYALFVLIRRKPALRIIRTISRHG
jgi:Zn-dependent peptidase ImmA (M78 family)